MPLELIQFIFNWRQRTPWELQSVWPEIYMYFECSLKLWLPFYLHWLKKKLTKGNVTISELKQNFPFFSILFFSSPSQSTFMFFGAHSAPCSQSSGGDSNKLWLLMISQLANCWWCPHLFVLSHIWLSERRRSDTEATCSCGRPLPAGRRNSVAARLETLHQEKPGA